MLRVGLVGCGGIMWSHLPGWRAVSDRAVITALCDIVPSRAKEKATDLGIDVPIFEDWNEMLASGLVDAVDLALPHNLHCAAIVDAAIAGKHVMTEKPLCITLEEAHRIEAAVITSGVTLMCAHNQMFEPAPRLAQRWVRDGKIGKVYSVRTVDCFLAKDRQSQGAWGWRGSSAEAGGGCALDTGYHPTYLLISIANSEPVEVVSFSANFNQPFLEAEDTAQTLVRFANGSIGTLQTSWGHPWPNGQWQIHAIGELGQIYGRKNILYFQPHGGEPEMHELDPENGFVGEIKHYVDCIETGSTPEQGLHEGISVLKIILGGYQSELNKRTQSI